MWFTESTGIGRITPAGRGHRVPARPERRPVVADRRRSRRQPLVHPVQRRIASGASRPTGRSRSTRRGSPRTARPSGITTGPDGRIWFAQFNGDRLGIVTLEPPSAVTGGPRRSGTLGDRVATVNPLDYPTTVRFDYGPTTAYGSSTPPVALAAGSAAVPVPGELTGLTPQSTVHFRVVATSAIGTTMGSDVTLVTARRPRSGSRRVRRRRRLRQREPERPSGRARDPRQSDRRGLQRPRRPVPAHQDSRSQRVRALRELHPRHAAHGPARAGPRADRAALQGAASRASSASGLRRAKASVDVRRRFLRGRELRPGRGARAAHPQAELHRQGRRASRSAAPSSRDRASSACRRRPRARGAAERGRPTLGRSGEDPLRTHRAVALHAAAQAGPREAARLRRRRAARRRPRGAQGAAAHGRRRGRRRADPEARQAASQPLPRPGQGRRAQAR